MALNNDRFYYTGGTLPLEASSYIVRKADTELYKDLLDGEFCYVLNTRQMGKSSLMVRTAMRLREVGVRVGILDLTAIGQNVTPEQWYEGLLSLLGDRLRLRNPLEDFWDAHPHLGPMQRWMTAIQEVVLPLLGTSSLVIFVDEIDSVRSLSFSTDEFFAGIRECYNRRTADPEFNRLTFCLLGVATPSDLIADTRVSPFNIGRKIVLSDFTPEEAAPLAHGFQRTLASHGNGRSDAGRDSLFAQALLSRVLYWTGGHPYMTQCLCRAIQEEGLTTQEQVDALSERMYPRITTRDTEDNLSFVRTRLLMSEVDRAALLDLYERVLRGKHVQDVESSPLCNVLRLAGVCKVVHGELRVRNRIYARVFDRAWIQANMPEAELWRQRRAFRHGVLRTGVVSGVLMAIMATLVAMAIRSAHRATLAELAAKRETSRANRLLYISNMNVAQQKLISGDMFATLQLLQDSLPKPGEPDLRDFEWYYLRSQCREARTSFQASSKGVQRLAFAPDGTLYTNADHGILATDSTSGAALRVLPYEGPFALSRQGDLLAVADRPGQVRIVSAASSMTLNMIAAPNKPLFDLTFSSDGTLLAAATTDRDVYVFDVNSGRLLQTLRGHTGKVYCVRFAPDGKTLASGGEDHRANLWDPHTGKLLHTLTGHSWYVYTLAFTPDSRRLVTAGGDGKILLWEVASGQKQRELLGHESYIYSLSIAPAGNLLASASWDSTVRIWDLHTGQNVRVFRGHAEYVLATAFAQDGKVLASGDYVGNVKLWNMVANPPFLRLQEAKRSVIGLVFSPDSKTLFAGSFEGEVSVWDADLGTRLSRWDSGRGVSWLALSRDGTRLFTFHGERVVRVWDVSTHRLLQEVIVPQKYTASYASDDGTMLLAQGENGNVLVMDAATGKARMTIHAGQGDLDALFCPDNRHIVTAELAVNTSAHIRIWDLDSGKMVKEWSAYASPLVMLRRVDASTMMVSSNAAGDLTVWDTAGAELGAYSGVETKEYTASIRFLPDGRRMLRRDQHNVSAFVDPETGRELITLSAGKRDILSIIPSPNGKLIAVGCSDGSICLWEANP